MARLQQLVDSRCLQQHSFWVKLRHHPPQLPMALQNVQSWDTFIAQVADARLPPALFLPDSAYPQQDTARAAVLNEDLQWRRWSASCPSYTMAGLQAMQTCLQSSCAMRNSPPSPISHCPHICWRQLLRSSSRP